MTEQASIFYFIQKRPHNDRRMVSITLHNPIDTAVPALFKLRRRSQFARPKMLFASQQAKLIQQIELTGKGSAACDPDRVKAHRLHVEHVPPQQVFVVRSGLRNRVLQDRIERAVYPNAAPVHTEVAVLEAEVAKSASHRALVHTGTPCKLDAPGHAVKEWVIQLPKAMPGNAEDRLNRIVASLEQLLHPNRGHGFGPVRRRAVKSCQSAHSLAGRIPNIRLDANIPGFPVWNHVKIFDAYQRREQQLHRSSNAASVVRIVTWHRIISAAGCHFFQPNTVD